MKKTKKDTSQESLALVLGGVAIGVCLCLVVMVIINFAFTPKKLIPDGMLGCDAPFFDDSKWDAEWMQYGGRLQEVLTEVLPKTDFGGVWIANNGRIHIGLVAESDTTAASREKILDEAKKLGIVDNGLDVVSVKNSWEALNEVNSSIGKIYKENTDYDNKWPIYAGVRTDINKVSVYIPKRQENLSDGHKKTIETIVSDYKNQVCFETYHNLAEDE